MKKYLGEILLTIGSGVLVYNVFNFSFRTSRGISLPSISDNPVYGAAYYYDDTTLVFLALGMILLVSGILIMRNKK